MANQSPAPVQQPMVEPETLPSGQKNPNARIVANDWLRWFNTLIASSAASVVRQASVSLTGQNSALAVTQILPVVANAGIYELSYVARITTVGSVSSSLQITLAWTDHGAPQTFVGTAITGNLTTSYQTNTLKIWADAGVPMTYSTAYASNAAGQMQYQLYVILQAVLV